MRAVNNETGFRINSLAGTGDLQNIQRKGVDETVGTGTGITTHSYRLSLWLAKIDLLFVKTLVSLFRILTFFIL